MAFTFFGGVHLRERKNTRHSEIVKMPAPPMVSIPLSLHNRPCVSVGDMVLRGQLIGSAEFGAGCPTHSSVSGTVTAIEDRLTPTGALMPHIVIKSDGLDTLSPYVQPQSKRISEFSSDEIIDVIFRAGIVGMGGAGFPTALKLRSALGKATRLIINGIECEPYLNADHRVMLEKPAAVINGTKILMKALGIRQGEIAIADNKLDAANVLEQLLGGSSLIKIRVCKTKYPQGSERQLIYAVTGIEVPMGKLPHDYGLAIFNVETCVAVYEAFTQGMPLVDRVVTVDGDCVREPKNVLVPIGTAYADLFEFCGGFCKPPKKIINGGPMMGVAQWDLQMPVTKVTNGLLAFSQEMETVCKNPPACIRCGRCIRACPMKLMPNNISLYTTRGRYDDAEKYGANSCIECGSCAYVCPARIPLVADIRTAKAHLRKRQATAPKADGGQAGAR